VDSSFDICVRRSVSGSVTSHCHGRGGTATCALAAVTGTTAIGIVASLVSGRGRGVASTLI
jgi:hypothetical protein